MEYSTWVLIKPNFGHCFSLVERNIKGKNGAEGHAGATNVPGVLQVKRCFIADKIKHTGEQSSYFHLASFVKRHQLLHSSATKIMS